MAVTVHTTAILATAKFDGLEYMAHQHSTELAKRYLAQHTTMERVVRPMECQLGLEQWCSLEWWMELVLNDRTQSRSTAKLHWE